MKRIVLWLMMIITVLVLTGGCGSSSAPAENQAKGTPPPEAEKAATAVPSGIPILMYHKIGSDADNDAVIREDLFRAQMKFLKDNGYHPLTLEQLRAYVTDGTPVPVKPVVLTFDDGYADTYTIAYPVLKEYGFAGTVFVNPEDVGTRLTWQQLREMNDNGFVVASHGYVHKRMNEMSEPEQLNNIVEAQKILKDKLGIDNKWFCYPYGRNTAYTRQAAKESGIQLAVEMNPGWAHRGDNVYALKRVWIGNAVDLKHFEERITTEHYTDL